jgi:hypothetical protein
MGRAAAVGEGGTVPGLRQSAARCADDSESDDSDELGGPGRRQRAECGVTGTPNDGPPAMAQSESLACRALREGREPAIRVHCAMGGGPGRVVAEQGRLPRLGLGVFVASCRRSSWAASESPGGRAADQRPCYTPKSRMR